MTLALAGQLVGVGIGLYAWYRLIGYARTRWLS